MTSRDSGLVNAISLQAGFTEAAPASGGDSLRVGIAILSSVPVSLPLDRVEVAVPGLHIAPSPSPLEEKKRQSICSYTHCGKC